MRRSFVQEEDGVENEVTVSSTATSQQRKRTRKNGDPYDFESSADQTAELATPKRQKKLSQAKSVSDAASQAAVADSFAMDTIEEESLEIGTITEERFEAFKKTLTQLFRESRAQSIPMSRFCAYLEQQHATAPFRKAETNAAFARMTDANQIMIADDVIFLI